MKIKVRLPKNRWFGTSETYNGRYSASVGFRTPHGNWKTTFLGIFDSEIDAARAAWKFKIEVDPGCGWPYPEEANARTREVNP